MLQVKGAAAKYGFEAALVMCGKVVNEDVSLGFAHTTAGEKKVRFNSWTVLILNCLQFFETCCQSDEHAMIGHLKVHIQ